ncbi:glycosyltransferase [Cellulosimicrobium sp. 72-3]|uniref:glycosyltransferase n=1 Tax=Cellulosimicrobium sp. 72-3 TaxID=2731680 RepID=UPI0020A27ED5|nr:glycosyltransferase [Cellulosimicrobium sp. 72-3]
MADSGKAATEASSGSRRISAVITAFRPERSLLDNVRRLAAQVDEIVVVDDGSGDTADAVLDELRRSGVQVVRREHNRGIAGALNAGVAAVDPGSDDLLLTFDQDSAIPPGFVAALVDAWDRGTAAGLRMGLVAPARFAGLPQTEGEQVLPGIVRAREPIQSGTLYSGASLSAVGAFRDDLFIDLVDTEYFLRIRNHGLDALAVVGVDLPHELGRTYVVRVFGLTLRTPSGPLTTSLSTPFRYYYRARNRVVLNRAYASQFTAYTRRDTLMELRHLILVLLLARPRRDILRVIRRGLADGRGGRMGRIPADVEALARRVSWRGEELRSSRD